MANALAELNQIIPPREAEQQPTQQPELPGVALQELNAIIPARPEEKEQIQVSAGKDVISPASGITVRELLDQQIGEDVVSEEAFKEASLGQAVQSEGELVAAGSMAGTGLAGARAGSVIGPAGAVGGALGAMAGELLFQTVEDIGRQSGMEDLGESPKFSERITAAGKEGVIDLGFLVGAKAVTDLGVLGFKKLISKETRELIEEADKLGVDPTKLVVTNSKVKDFYKSVVARFPFSSGAFRGRSKKAVEQLQSAKELLFMRMGPSWDMAKLGVNMDQAFKKEFSAFRKAMNVRYGMVMEEAKKVGAVIDTAKIRKTAVEQTERLRIALQAQGMSDQEIADVLRTDPAFKRLVQYTRMKPTVTLEEFRAMDDILDKDLAFAGGKGGELVAQFGRVKDSFQGAKDSIRQLVAPEEGGKTVKEMLRDADETFYKTMTEVFETPVAKKQERMVNKKMFSVGQLTKAGTRNPDETFKLLWNTKSPQSMEQLHKVVGTDRFGAATRTHFETLWDKSVQKGFDDFMEGTNKLAFDFNGFKRSLGIGNPKSAEYLTTKRALELSGSGVTMKDMTKFTALLENALRNAPENVNAFIARRAVLGGRPGVMSSLGMGATGLLQSAMTMFLSSTVGTIISSKPLMVRIGMILDPNISVQHRKALMVSFNKMLEDQ